jgi:hypothetical protein
MELEKPARCCTKPKNEQSPMMSCGQGQLAIAFSLVGLAQNAAALDDVADTFYAFLRKEEFFRIQREACVRSAWSTEPTSRT